MFMDWKSYLNVSMFLAPNDENRVRFLTNQVPEDKSDSNASTAKNIAVSAAVEQFLPCWIGQKTSTVYLGGLHDYSVFDYKKYDPRADPLYVYMNEPNFRCDLILSNPSRALLFSSSDPFDGTVEQLIIIAIRVHAYRLKLKEKGRPNFWMADGPQGPAIISLVLMDTPPPGHRKPMGE